MVVPRTWSAIGVFALAATWTAATRAQTPPTEQLVQAKSPPFSEGIYPCKECHDGPGDKTRRTLAFHEDIQTMFDHDAEHRWCLDCHDNADRNVLHLSSGDPVPFTESYRLCGQCHGPQYKDWKVGIHGKRTGYWNGAKRYLLCVNCHNPHNPHFAPLKPLPPPVRPHFLRASDRPEAPPVILGPDGGVVTVAPEEPKEKEEHHE